MTWCNRDKTKWLDLDRVSFWHYNSQVSQEKELKEFRKKHGSIFPTHSTLMVVVDGATIEFVEKEAEEIYNLLISKKTLLKN